MSSAYSSRSSSRSSTAGSQIGLLNEKHKCDADEKLAGSNSSLKLQSFSQLPNVKLRLSLRYLGGSLVQLCGLLVPTFLHRRPQNDHDKANTLAPTAFLDGMRGLAAFVVFICHLTYGTFDITRAWGAPPDPETQSPAVYRDFLRLPIARLLYSGPPMVAIFFVVSGYALSYKPLKQMRARQHDQLMTTMTSSVFRRGLRLFVPCFASTFIVICLAQVGLYTVTEDFSKQMRMMPESHCYTQPNMWLQFKDWRVQMLIFVDVFNWSLFAGSIELDRHLWTIPVEFRCSMALFLTHMLTARMSSRLRIMTIFGLIIWGMSWDRWELCPFWAGAVIAESDIIRASNVQSTLPAMSSNIGSQEPCRASKIMFWATFLVSLFLLSFPDTAGDNTPGFVYLDSLIPASFSEKHRFWPTIGAVMIVWSSCRLLFLRDRVFCWAPGQYLGKISFPLYVMHGPIIHTLGYLILPRTPEVETPDILRHFQMDFAKAAVVVVVAVIWAADVFLRVVDTPCVNLARRLEKIFFND